MGVREREREREGEERERRERERERERAKKRERRERRYVCRARRTQAVISLGAVCLRHQTTTEYVEVSKTGEHPAWRRTPRIRTARSSLVRMIFGEAPSERDTPPRQGQSSLGSKQSGLPDPQRFVFVCYMYYHLFSFYFVLFSLFLLSQIRCIRVSEQWRGGECPGSRAMCTRGPGG